jgi:hypothetical protein
VNKRCRSLVLMKRSGGSVADPDPDFYLSRILDTTTTKEGKKKFGVLPFSVVINFIKCKIFYFKTGTEKNLSQL